MASKKKVRAKRKSNKWVVCGGCKSNLLVSYFDSNPHMENGFLPWCIVCLETLRASGIPSQRKEYRAAYQRSYHNKRRAVEGVSRTVTRGARRLSKAILARRIPRELTLEAVRRESVQRDLLALMPALKKTKVWQMFEDELIAGYEEREIKVESTIERVLPIEHYPEFALHAANCFPKGVKNLSEPGATFPICVSFALLGLARLAGCVLEVLGCDAEAETV